MEKMRGLIVIATLILLLAGQAWAGSIFDTEYTKYPRATYEKYCGHYLTAGGHWDCLDALDRDGIPDLGCSDPSMTWYFVDRTSLFAEYGWKPYPLNFYEEINNPEYEPGVFWFYRCRD